jgi:hypothetical protein
VNGLASAERLTLLVALLSVVASLSGVAIQLRRQWLLNSAAMVTQFVDKYDSPQMRADRQRLATRLVQHLESGDGSLPNYEPVLGFFENIGYLARKGVLDIGMLHNKFGFDLQRWHAALRRRGDLVEAFREQLDESTIYCEIDWLAQAFLRIDRRLGKRGGHTVSMESVVGFLEQECGRTQS